MGERVLSAIRALMAAVWPRRLPAGAAESDRRLDRVEHEQQLVEARLRLLEYQSNPRGIGRRDGD